MLTRVGRARVSTKPPRLPCNMCSFVIVRCNHLGVRRAHVCSFVIVWCNHLGVRRAHVCPFVIVRCNHLLPCNHLGVQANIVLGMFPFVARKQAVHNKTQNTNRARVGFLVPVARLHVPRARMGV